MRLLIGSWASLICFHLFDCSFVIFDIVKSITRNDFAATVDAELKLRHQWIERPRLSNSFLLTLLILRLIPNLQVFPNLSSSDNEPEAVSSIYTKLFDKIFISCDVRLGIKRAK